MGNNPTWEVWLREVRRIAVEQYEFTAKMAESHFNHENMWGYFSRGNTPKEAIKDEREYGDE